MKIKIVDNVVVITSEITKEMYEKLEKHLPGALSLEDEEENEVFKIARGSKSISNYGIVFDTVSTEGKLRLSLVVENVTAEKIAEDYSNALLLLQEIEENAIEMYTKLNERLLDLAATIEVVALDEVSDEVEEAE